MEPYLIALDLDGTLLKDDKTISARTKDTLLTLKNEGHHIVISTGRPYRASKAYYEELGLDTPIINFNGTYVHHPLEIDWGIFHEAMPLKTAQDVIRTCEALHIKNIMVEVKDDVYIKNPDPAMKEMFSVGEPTIVTGELSETLKEDPSCILIQTNVDATEPIIKAIEQNHANAVDQRSWGAPTNIIEVIPCGINKAVGLKRVANDLQVPQDRIIAFGDEDNDLEMLKYAGCGVAMGNALDELKNVANNVTVSNENDGIGKYLEHYFQLQK